MIRSLLLACLLPGIAIAAEPAAPDKALDLSVPQAPIRYLADPSVQRDPPGTFYGDHSGRGLARGKPAEANVSDDGLQVNGAVTVGVGYSERYGNSNFQALDLNLGKDYTNDEGRTRRLDLHIHVSQGEGPGPYGPPGMLPHPGW